MVDFATSLTSLLTVAAEKIALHPLPDWIKIVLNLLNMMIIHSLICVNCILPYCIGMLLNLSHGVE